MRIDLSRASLWDSSAISAVDKVVGKLRRNGARVTVIPPEGEGRELIDRLATYNSSTGAGVSH